MKKMKSIVIILMLLINIATITGSFANAVIIKNERNQTVLQEVLDGPVEKPNWQIGDSWTYGIEIQGNDNTGDIDFDISISDVTFTVVSDSTDSYKLSVFGDFEGSGSYLGLLSGRIRDGRMSGDAYVRKSDIAMVKLENMHITGTVAFVPFDVDVYSIGFYPAFSSYAFPININDEWDVETTVMAFIGYINQPGVAAGDIDLDLHTEEYTQHCQGLENKQGYQALKIKGNHVDSWYSSDAGNTVYVKNFENIKLLKWGLTDDYFTITNFEMTLTTTNYEPPDDEISITKPKSSYLYNSATGVEGKWNELLNILDISLYIFVPVEIKAESNNAYHMKFVMEDASGLFVESPSITGVNDIFSYTFDKNDLPTVGVITIKAIAYNSNNQEIGRTSFATKVVFITPK